MPALMLLTLILAVPTCLSAQPMKAERPRPPVEIGAGIEYFKPIPFDFDTDDLTTVSGDLRLTVPFTPQFAVEGTITIGQRDTSYAGITEGLYLLQVKQRLPRLESKRLRPFLLYGAVGYYQRNARHEWSGIGLDGRLYTVPPATYWEIEQPIATALGGGFHYDLSRRVSIRSEAQIVTLLWIPILSRFSTGVSISVGGNEPWFR